MQIVTIEINDRLRQFVKHMWVVEEGGASNVSIRAFPVGYAFINVIDGTPFSIVDKCATTNYSSYLAGPRSSYYSLNMSFIRRALTIQLQPYALPYLFSMPASEFTEQIVHLADFVPSIAHRMEDLISSQMSSSQILRQVEQFLLSQMHLSEIDERVSYSLDVLLRKGGDIRMSQLASSLNMSQRRMQQLFQQYYGITAKRYSKIIKMQHHTFHLLNGYDLDRIVPQGYYDQSHFIHELRSQTGMLPREFYNYIIQEKNRAAYLNSSIFLDRQTF